MQTVFDTIYTQIREKLTGGNTVLLHPDSRYRSVMVALLASDPNLQVFYHALRQNDLDVATLMHGMMQSLAVQNPLFGRHFSMLPREKAEKPDRYHQEVYPAFMRDVCELSDKPFILILDEYDYSEWADDVQRLIAHLIANLPAHCNLVINGRTMPRLPLQSLIARGNIYVMQDEQLIIHHFYGAPRPINPAAPHVMEVFALGPGFVVHNGQAIDTWEGHLPRLLFFFALDRPTVTRSEICQAFWPELDDEQAVNVFHVTKRRLHKALDMDVLVHNEGYYAINPQIEVDYDLTRYVQHLMNARYDGADTVAAWQGAVSLYRGPFLQGHQDRWVLERRADYRISYLATLMKLAEHWQRQERNDRAISMYQRALDEDPARQDIHRGLMRLYHRLGRRSEAVTHYHKLLTLYKKLGLALEPATETLFRTELND
jgi:DNA-binding SARP family transcriptional activator